MMCVFCHCTDTQACEGGCSWARPEVCSACVHWIGPTGAKWRVLAVAEGHAMVHNPRVGACIAEVGHMREGQFGWRRAAH